MRIDFIRHGQCNDNAFLRGRSDTGLSFLGQRQMRRTLDDINLPELVVCSPAKRSADLAQSYYLEASSITEVELWDDFQERDFGIWDGLSFEAIQALDSVGLQKYLDQPFNYEISGSETLEAFETRVKKVFRKLLDYGLEKEVDHLVVVTHGGVMRVLLKQVLGLNDFALFQLEMGFASRMSLECIETSPENMMAFAEQLEQLSAQDSGRSVEKPDQYYIKLLELTQCPLKA